MKINMKSRSHWYDIYRRRSRHEQKYSKYKKYLSIMMLICIKQHHLRNIWRTIHEKCKQYRGWIEKKNWLIKKSVLLTRFEYWYWSIVFLLTCAEPQISTAPQDFCNHDLTSTKLKCKWGKYTKYENHIYLGVYIIMVGT